MRQDGVRYVMPCVLALALIAAAGFDQLARLVALRHAFTALAAARRRSTSRSRSCASIRTTSTTSASRSAAPATVAAHGWFETAWWGEGVDRAVDYVNAHARAGRARLPRLHRAGAPRLVPRGSLGADDQHPGEATWIVSYAPTAPCAIPPDARRVFTVDADGAMLAEVWQRPNSR